MKKLSLLLIALFLTSTCFAVEINLDEKIKSSEAKVNQLINDFNQYMSEAKKAEQRINEELIRRQQRIVQAQGVLEEYKELHGDKPSVTNTVD